MDFTDLRDEQAVVRRLAADVGLSPAARAEISTAAAALVQEVRAENPPNLMDSFLAEYGLSNKEGVALMCLAEALLRVPDTATIDSLIADKLAPSNWGAHLGHSNSLLVNASTWALMLTGRFFAPDNLPAALRGAVHRLGEPVVRAAIGVAMQKLGDHFVLGEDIESALRRAKAQEAEGYLYSYDMLGEAARCESDAHRYHLAYADAIGAVAKYCGGNIRANPSVSVKLSALYSRYEYAQREEVLHVLVPRLRSLALLAASANTGLTIDAEEAERLDISLEVIDSLFADKALADWHGLGFVVQAYGKRAVPVIEWLYRRVGEYGGKRRLMLRLVKGAYWDTEIKRAQILGLPEYPVFTAKTHSDISYIACARKLLRMTDRLFPQFATHNAHSIAAVLHLAAAENTDDFEFQRLHGMGEALHAAVLRRHGNRCRIYAPVGAHQDLLAYLVRRLLENGANSSFVSQVVDNNIAAQTVTKDPFIAVEEPPLRRLPLSPALFEDRRNSRGWDLTDAREVKSLLSARETFRTRRWTAAPMLSAPPPLAAAGELRVVVSPARMRDVVGWTRHTTAVELDAALAAAKSGFADWSARAPEDRAQCLENAAELYEQNAAEFFALCARETGKTLPDCVAELREAVDFLRYYAAAIRACRQADKLLSTGRGVFVCISPWNFPLAIFTGQIAAALAAGNAVLAKPAEQSTLIAARATALMRQAGVPPAALQLLPGDGTTVGAALVGRADIDGVCFTGSTAVAVDIHRALAANADPAAVLIAETGGINAMIADSTALPEQVTRDVIASAFQSAGQRCSALRVLFVQEEAAARIVPMITGAMEMLKVGDPWQLETDIGPLINQTARHGCAEYCAGLEADGALLAQAQNPPPVAMATECYLPPVAFKVPDMAAVSREIFAPVLHIATYAAGELEQVIDAINATGYGLTFGLHSRIDARVRLIGERIRAGNLYINRNQIGAMVGVQPFGGEGLSGTGPKAGGPNYLGAFMRETEAPPPEAIKVAAVVSAEVIEQAAAALAQEKRWATHPERYQILRSALAALPDEVAALAKRALAAAEKFLAAPVELPGPTGEMNRLSYHPRGVFLCLGGGVATALAQAVQSLAAGGGAVVAVTAAEEFISSLHAAGVPVTVVAGAPAAVEVTALRHIAGLAACAPAAELRPYKVAWAARAGAILPFVTAAVSPLRYAHERAVCIDTTAAGGNTELLSIS